MFCDNLCTLLKSEQTIDMPVNWFPVSIVSIVSTAPIEAQAVRNKYVSLEFA